MEAGNDANKIETSKSILNGRVMLTLKGSETQCTTDWIRAKKEDVNIEVEGIYIYTGGKLFNNLQIKSEHKDDHGANFIYDIFGFQPEAESTCRICSQHTVLIA